MGRVCPWRHAYTFDNVFRRWFHKPEIILEPYVKEGMTVMDVGCGMSIFSIGMAKMVGEQGCVISVDLQRGMLDVLWKRAEKAGVADRIRTHQCEPDVIGVEVAVDFILAFWMVHEVPDTDAFFSQLRSCLNPEGKFLVAEPKFHVSAGHYRTLLSSAENAGLKRIEDPPIRFSRATVFVAT